MEATRVRDTEAEVRVRQQLHSLGLRFRVDVKIAELPRRRADIVFRRQQVAVFIDGCFWHGCPIHGTTPKSNRTFWYEKIRANRTRDKDTDDRLRALGWTVIRAWEHEDATKTARKVHRAVSRPTLRRRQSSSGAT
jgi:DNA mismatch endonuclease, patch repair protein